VVFVEKESILALFKQLQDDYKTCMEKDLETKEELHKQTNFINNFTALLDFLEKLKAPDGIKNDVKEILKILRSWDVYAFWFKEMKDIVAKFKAFSTNFTSYGESSGIIPKMQKPAEKAPEKPAAPGLPAPQKPSPPATLSLLKPIVMGAAAGQKPVPSSISPQKPVAPGLPATVGLAGESRERAVPLLKPVFKTPAVKTPTGEKPGAEPPIDETTAPTPLKALVGEKKLEIHVKPVKLIKPIVAVKQAEPEQQAPVTEDMPPASEEQGTREIKPIRLVRPTLAVPVVETKPVAPRLTAAAQPAATQPSQKGAAPLKPAVPTLAAGKAATPQPQKNTAKIDSKPAGSEKPLLIPKPIKIVVPELGKIDLDEEVKPVEDFSPAGDETLLGEPFEMIPAPGSPAREARAPSRVVKPIPVKIQINKTSTFDENDDVVKEVAEKMTKHLAVAKKPAQKPATAPAQKPAEDEFLTPAEVSLEDIDEWAAEEQPGKSPGKVPSDKEKKIAEMLEADTWDEGAISEILDEAVSETPKPAATKPPAAGARPAPTPRPLPGGEKEPASAGNAITSAFKTYGPPSFDKKGSDKKGSDKKFWDKKGGDKKAPTLDVIDEEPPQDRLQEIKKSAEPDGADSGAEAADSMSLFTGALTSKIKDGGKKSGQAGPFFNQRAPGGPSSGQATAPRSQATEPLGSDVDVDALPETKDGLYQALIALEGKRYAIERAKKDLRADMDKGTLKPTDYEKKLADLKVEMDKIGDKIKEIREKIKKFK